jgi:pSer/pThr/pTyr-binding forkhead associated (FHA) protein
VIFVSVPAHASVSIDRSADVLLLTTEQKVHGFVIAEVERISIGRHASNDLQLDSRKVSNYHAEIVRKGTGVWLHDLRSTNGTFVNEERVTERQLCNGDCVRFGTNEVLVELTTADAVGDETVTAAAPLLPEGRFVRGEGANAVSGLDGEPRTLRDVILEFAHQVRWFRLVLNRGESETVTAFVSDGTFVYAQSGDVLDEKALYRAFEWKEGRYRLEVCANDESMPRRMTIPVESLVDEGEKQASALDELLQRLPPPDVPLRLREASKTRICDLSSAEFNVFQALIRYETPARILESSGLTDLRVMATVESLLRKKVFEIEENSSLFQKTTTLDRI